MYTANTAHWTSQASLYLIFLGLSSHLYFVRGEWDNAIWKQILALFLLQPLSLVVLVASGCGVLGSFMTTLILDLSYLLPLFLSIALYRLFFHRLHKFPGPFWARLSMLWMVKKLNNQDQYELLHALHQKYGDVVRIGMERKWISCCHGCRDCHFNRLTDLLSRSKTDIYQPRIGYFSYLWGRVEVPEGGIL